MLHLSFIRLNLVGDVSEGGVPTRSKSFVDFRPYVVDGVLKRALLRPQRLQFHGACPKDKIRHDGISLTLSFTRLVIMRHENS